MELECLILRAGITPVVLGTMKFPYQFRPIPGSKKGEMTTSVCEIQNEKHVEYLLKTGQYREYDQDVAYKDLLERRKKEEAVAKAFKNLAVVKYHERGYVVVDSRAKVKKFIDKNGTHDSNVGLMPFDSEADAYQALKEEAQFPPPDAVEDDPKKPKVGVTTK